MFEYLYEWIKNIAFYLILAAAAVNMMPDDTYKKYIHFFIGLILILLFISPFFKIFEMEDSFFTLFQNEAYRQEMETIQRKTEYLKEIEKRDGQREIKEVDEKIEVEEIRLED